MSNETTRNSGGGVGIPTVVCIVFIILKLTHVVAWSWWWVFSPLLIGWGLGIVILLVMLIVVGVMKRR